MWLAPEFHHGPRPLLADFQARVSSKPRACRCMLRVAGLFHCRHSRQRSLRRIHPSNSCNTLFTSISRKYDVLPCSTGLSVSIVLPKLRAFVCPHAAVPPSAPPAIDEIRSSPSVMGAVACLVASSIGIEVVCPTRVVQCSGLRSGLFLVHHLSPTYYALC